MSLSHAYRVGDGLVYALDGVSVEIHPGEMVAIEGKSGTGKSSLLQILGCLQRPKSGQVRIEGLDVSKYDDVEIARVRFHKIGFLYETSNFLPSETALENVEVPLRRQGVPVADRRQKAAEALGIVGLEKHLETRAGQLSPIQRKHVAIARALVNSPIVILADEPTKGLDANATEGIMGVLQKLNDAGLTIIATASDPSVANYCRRILRMSQGRIAEDRSVSKRVIVPSSKRLGSPVSELGAKQTKSCASCSYGNPPEAEICQVCGLQLSAWRQEPPSSPGRATKHDQIEELKGIPIFLGLSSRNLAKLVINLESRDCPEGSTIIKQGGPG
jgi:putative ABC transport system ATP-binding protein